jgi:hypothetical protein
MESATRQKRGVSFRMYKALAAIRELSQDELMTLQKEVFRKPTRKIASVIQPKPEDTNTTFFLFGKYPDFEDATTLRQKAWKRNCI